MIQINRFTTSNAYGRSRKNRHPLVIYQHITLGLTSYSLLGYIEHRGVSFNSGHYVCCVIHNNKWYQCDDGHIQTIDLHNLSNDVYLLFYMKRD